MEQRAHTRRKTLKHGTLTLRDDGKKVDCIVRDIGAGGARIWRPHYVSLPARFHLSVPGELSGPVELRWQAGQEAGVRFVGLSAARRPRRSFGRNGATAA